MSASSKWGGVRLELDIFVRGCGAFPRACLFRYLNGTIRIMMGEVLVNIPDDYDDGDVITICSYSPFPLIYSNVGRGPKTNRVIIKELKSTSMEENERLVTNYVNHASKRPPLPPEPTFRAQ